MVRKVNHDQVIKALKKADSGEILNNREEFKLFDYRDVTHASKLTSDPMKRKYYAKLLGIKD
ncbi:hypothetical protein [Bacillus sp. Marseille-P3800]|uniref:hypothetical protein n=1 Tax=Bacillus sp. Marseille-P3800 TaxID=2014782 RepID=UPI000C072341|nr:hypothetical protein [Bacillus sp. Marseille-P3800]